MDKNKLDKMVEETINSMDASERAMPAPFLLTRIKAGLVRETAVTPWEKISAFLVKPFVAFPALAVVLVLNFWIIRSSVSPDSLPSSDYSKVSTDDYSLGNATSLFDIENGQR
jgi:hypothetical protein